jgi:hypothetical protein
LAQVSPRHPAVNIEAPVLFVMAHMDDETVYAWKTIKWLRRQHKPVFVLAATTPKQQPRARRRGFLAACRELGVEPLNGYLPDAGMDSALPRERLARALARACRRTGARTVFCHGPLGEYGHQHHRAVWRACVASGADVLFLAGPFQTLALGLPLTPRELARKQAAFRKHYAAEGGVWRFCTAQENWCRAPLPAAQVRRLKRLRRPERHAAEMRVLLRLPWPEVRAGYVAYYRQVVREFCAAWPAS